MESAERPSCWKIERWPAADRLAWARSTRLGDPFDDEISYASTLRPASLAKAAKGYGRWLCFLHARGWLDEEKAPLERVTPGQLRAYFDALRKQGNADYTVIGRFDELWRALMVLSPGQDVSWVRRPFGGTIHSSLIKRRRPMRVPSCTELFRWGLELMDTAAGPLGPNAFRDGLMIALFASRARRVRSMSVLRVGQELIDSDDGFWIELEPEHVKTKKFDRFPLPQKLDPYLRRYLDVARPTLLRGAAHDALWITREGRPLSYKGIQAMVERRSKARFGYTFGPHRFRHALVTTAILTDPANPGMAAALLGASAQVIEQHYNMAGQIHASQKFCALVEDG